MEAPFDLEFRENSSMTWFVHADLRSARPPGPSRRPQNDCMPPSHCVQVHFEGETLQSDVVQGCYTDGLQENNTLHWTLNLAVTDCSASLALSSTVPQFGKEGTFALGADDGKGYVKWADVLP